MVNNIKWMKCKSDDGKEIEWCEYPNTPNNFICSDFNMSCRDGYYCANKNYIRAVGGGNDLPDFSPPPSGRKEYVRGIGPGDFVKSWKNKKSTFSWNDKCWKKFAQDTNTDCGNKYDLCRNQWPVICKNSCRKYSADTVKPSFGCKCI